MAAQRYTSPHSATKGCQGTPTAQRGLNALRRAYMRHKLEAGLQERTKFAPETLPRGERAPRAGAKGCQAKGSAKQVHGSFTACGVLFLSETRGCFGSWVASRPKTGTVLLDVSYGPTDSARMGGVRQNNKKTKKYKELR